METAALPQARPHLLYQSQPWSPNCMFVVVPMCMNSFAALNPHFKGLEPRRSTSYPAALHTFLRGITTWGNNFISCYDQREKYFQIYLCKDHFFFLVGGEVIFHDFHCIILDIVGLTLLKYCKPCS